MAKPDVTGAGKQNPPEGGTECGSAVCYRALHRPANQCPNILRRWLETLQTSCGHLISPHCSFLNFPEMRECQSVGASQFLSYCEDHALQLFPLFKSVLTRVLQRNRSNGFYINRQIGREREIGRYRQIQMDIDTQIYGERGREREIYSEELACAIVVADKSEISRASQQAGD